MATWNKARPSGGEAWSLGDDRIRDNFDYLEQFLSNFSTFPINPADPNDRAVGKYKHGTLAARPVMTLASQTGAVYYAEDQGRVFICADGASNNWLETSRFGGGVQFDSAASFSAGFSASGTALMNLVTALSLITASGGLQVPSLKTVKGPAGEQWLVDSGAKTMDPHLHGVGRHRLTGSEGAWVPALDVLTGALVAAPKTGSISGASGLTGAYVTQLTIAYNLTGRQGGAVRSRILAVAFGRCSATGTCDVETKWQMGGADSSFAPLQSIVAPAAGNGGGLVIDYFEATNANLNFTLQMRNGAGSATRQSVYGWLFDFGETA